jgi:hypothetical protein
MAGGAGTRGVSTASREAAALGRLKPRQNGMGAQRRAAVVVERTVLPLCACVTGGSCYTAGNIGSKVRCGIAERLPKIFRPGISLPGDRVPRTSIDDCRSKIVPTLKA